MSAARRSRSRTSTAASSPLTTPATHEQCSLAEEGTLEGTVITCACHGAQFDAATGAVLAPPAVEPLQAYQVRVDGDDVVVEL